MVSQRTQASRRAQAQPLARVRRSYLRQLYRCQKTPWMLISVFTSLGNYASSVSRIDPWLRLAGEGNRAVTMRNTVRTERGMPQRQT